MAIVLMHDAIHANIAHLPPGQSAGYTTGSPDIKWTDADWHAHPKAVRIDQDFAATDPSADILDVERGAATNTESARWYRQALADFNKGVRPGQRHPAIYTSASNVTPLVNALIADGLNSGPGLWVANWNLSNAQAVAEVVAAAGPYPIIGVQFMGGAPGRPYDTSVMSGSWLAKQSGDPPDPPPDGPPFRHTARWWQTPAGIAKRRNTTVQHIAEVSAANYKAADWAVLARKRIRNGIVYYTDHP